MSWEKTLLAEWRNNDDEEYSDWLFNTVGDRTSVIPFAMTGVLLGVIYGLVVAYALTIVWHAWAGSIGFFLVCGISGLAPFAVPKSWLSWRRWLQWLSPEPRVFDAKNSGVWQWLFLSVICCVPAQPIVLFLVGRILGPVIVTLPAVLAIAAGVTLYRLSPTDLGLDPVFRNCLVAILIIGGSAAGFGSLLPGQRLRNAWRYRWLWFWWANRPAPLEVERALRDSRDGEAKVLLERLEQTKLGYRFPMDATVASPQKLVEELEAYNWKERFAARHTLLNLGGEAVDLLISKKGATSLWLLIWIADETANRLADATRFVCKRCLCRCAPHVVEHDGGQTLVYHGCIRCKQSREFYECPGKVIACVGSAPSNEIVCENGHLYVNCSLRGDAGEFDEVTIADATDQDVEAFVIRAEIFFASGMSGRPSRTCLIALTCKLLPNTVNMLRSRIGKVKFVPLQKGAKP